MRHLPQFPPSIKPIALAAGLLMGAQPAMPATITWVGPNASFWDLLANWDAGLPGALDDVALGAFDTTFRSGTVSVRSFNGSGRLSITGGQLSVSNDAFTGLLTFSGGTLAGAGTVSVSGAANWTAGTMTGAGRSQFNGDLTLSGAGLKDISNGRTLATAGTTTWTNTASGGGRIRTGGGIAINNSGSWLDQQAFDGSISQDFGGAASAFNNTGSYTKGGATTTAIGIAFNNTSSGAGTGVVHLDAGNLRLTGGGTSNGSFNGAAGTALVFGGNHSLLAGSSVNTAGTVEFISGTSTVAGSFNAGTSTTFSGGTTTFSGTVSGVGSTIVASGGTGVFNNTQAIAVSALQVSGGALTFNNTGGTTTSTLNLGGGFLSGTSTVTVSGATQWTAGTLTGAGLTQLNGDVTLSGAGLKDISNGRTLATAGTTTWTNTASGGGRIRTGGGITIDNGGSWLDQQAFDGSISQDFGGTASNFNNRGSYTKSGATTTSIGIAFNNTSSGAGTGVVTVNAGTLALGGGGTSNGSFQGAGTLVFSGGVHNLQAGSSVANPHVQFSGATVNVAGGYDVAGTTTVSNGTANFTGSVANSGGNLIVSGGAANFSNLAGVTVSTLALSGGTIGGTQSLTVAGDASWTAGTMTGTGSTTVQGTLTISGAGLKDLTAGRTLSAANTTWTNTAAGNGRIRTGAGVTIHNSGSWLDQLASDGAISPDYGGSAAFDNTGSYTKSGASTTTIGVAFNNTSSGAGTGVVNVNAGTLALGGGGSSNGSFLGAGALAFSGGVHNLEASSSVANPHVQFSGGTTTLAGSYNVSGSTTVSGGTANFTGSVAHSGGNLLVSSGAANFSNLAGVNVSTLAMSGGTIGGTQSLTVAGDASWTAGTMTGTGSTTVQGTLAISGAGLKDLTAGRTFNTASTSTTTWTNTAASNGRIRTGAGVTIHNSGSWLDQQAFNGAFSPDYGGTAAFNNIGSYTKSGAATTDVGIAFVNGNGTPGSGVLHLDAGTLVFSAGGSSVGRFNVADGSTLAFSAGTFTLGGTVASGSNGRVLASGATISTVGSQSFAGLLEMTAGTLNVNADATAARYQQSGGTLGGTGHLSIGDSAVWTAGTMTGTGRTTVQGTLAISGAGLKDLTAGRTFNTASTSTTTWTNTAANNGRIRTGAGVTIHNSGTWLDQQAFNGAFSPDYGGTAAFNNIGSYTKSGLAVTTVSIGFNNTGSVNVNAGQLDLTGGLTNFAGTTLTGGSFAVSGNSSLRFTGANVVTNAATVVLDGAGSALLNASNNANALANFASNTAAGSFTIRNGRNFSSAGAFSNAGTVQVGPGSTFSAGGSFANLASGQLQMAGGSFAGPALVNAGSVGGFGTVGTWVQNSGSVAATGGTLAANAGIQGASGAITVASGATLDLSAATVASSTGTLLNQGTLNLGAQALQVHADYDNSGFGSGNNFAARAGVLGSGALVGVNAALAMTGDVSSTAANQYVIDFGAVREGSTVTRSFQIANSGTGAGLRGALQTAANGASVTDARLSGSGVQAGNFGLLAAGARSGLYSITLSGNGTGGTLLPGQSLAVVSNFDNVALQSVQLSGLSTVLARGSATPAGPVNLGNFRVGIAPELQASLDVTNTTTGAGAEQLGLGSVATSGHFSAANTLGSGLVAPGASRAAAVAVSTQAGVVGTNQGSVTLQFISDGRDFDPSFSAIASNQQTVDLLATGYLVAQPTTPVAPVNVGNFRLVNGASSSFAVTNTNLAPAGLQEALNASAGPGTAGVTFSGSINGLAQGDTSNAMVIGFAAGGAAGVRNGSATLNLVSNGTGTSGLGLYALAPATVQVTGTAFNLAGGSTTPTPVTVANQRVGGNARAALTVSNTGPAGLFTEALNASFGASSGAATTFGSGINDLAAASSDNLSLGVGVNTATAGHQTGSVTLAYLSDGTGANGRSGLAAVSVGQQTINVSGDVYRLAVPVVNTAPITLVARVGDAAPSAAVNVANSGADAYTERLDASVASTPAGWSASGSVGGLATGQNSNALALTLHTTVAGSFAGTAGVALVSSGAGTTLAPDASLGSANVALTGRVYAPAVAQLPIGTIHFGTVRVGDVVPVRNVAVHNAAGGALADTLSASIHTLPGNGFAASGAVSGLAAGNSDTHTLNVSLDTASAGVFSGAATVGFSSHNPELADLALGSQDVALQGQVNRLAEAGLAQAGGDGSLSGGGTHYTLSFGTLAQGAGSLLAFLDLSNTALAPADNLGGGFDLSGITAGSPFTLGGFGSVDIAAGSTLAGLTVSFASGAAGVFDEVIVLRGLSTNGSGPDLQLADVQLHLTGTVVAVPEPGTYLLMAGGLLMLARVTRRRALKRAA